jgi:peptidyl-prolyl cis-trans isomerase C
MVLSKKMDKNKTKIKKMPSLSLIKSYCFAAIIFLIMISCGEPSKNTSKEVVATINNKKIYLEELQAKIGFLKPTKSVTDDKQIFDLKREILNKMIEREVILQEASRLGVEASSDEVESRVKSLLTDYSQKELDRALERENVNFKGWKLRIKEGLMIDKLIYQEINSKIVVTDKEIQEYYNQHKEEFHQPDQIRALQIVVEKEEEAYKVLEELSSGKDFKKLAQEKSISPDALEGGDLGFFSKGEMPEEFDNIVFKLKKGEISNIVISPYGFHIFKVIDKRKGGVKRLSSASEKIKKKLMMQKQNERFRIWVKGLKEKATITINEKLLS